MSEFVLLEVENQESPTQYFWHYLAIIGTTAGIVGAIFIVALPLLTYDLLNTQFFSDALINQLASDLTNFSWFTPVISFFFNAYGLVDLAINIIPWLLFWIAIKSVVKKQFVFPEQNWVSTVGTTFGKIIGYPILFSLVYGLLIGLHPIGYFGSQIPVSNILTPDQLRAGFEVSSFYIQIAIGVTYFISVFVNAYIHMTHIAPPIDSPLKRVQLWVQQQYEKEAPLLEEQQVIIEQEQFFGPQDQTNSPEPMPSPSEELLTQSLT